jgi:diguanylate cyclase
VRRYERGRQLVRRMYFPRTLGLALGGLAIGVVLWSRDTRVVEWVALVLSTLVWPHIAYRIGLRSQNPYRTELRSLMADSALGGAWIALMHFALLPSVVLAMMLSMDKLAVGGWDFLARCAGFMLAACLLCAGLTGFALEPDTDLIEIAGSLPLLVAYPVTVGLTTYRLARRVRDQNRLLAELSRTDGLSQLLNRRHWEELAAAEYQRCRRHQRVATLLMIDIDHFKSINDRFGHPCGDEAIKTVASLLRSSLRGQDVPGRYGGEEFGVILPETDLESGWAIAERVRRLVESSVLEREKGVRATVSVGLAELDPGSLTYTDWISHADRALYAAKAAGRNRSERYLPTV